jgi:hypothetical protein
METGLFSMGKTGSVVELPEILNRVFRPGGIHDYRTICQNQPFGAGFCVFQISSVASLSRFV